MKGFHVFVGFASSRQSNHKVVFSHTEDLSARKSEKLVSTREPLPKHSSRESEVQVLSPAAESLAVSRNSSSVQTAEDRRLGKDFSVRKS